MSQKMPTYVNVFLILWIEEFLLYILFSNKKNNLAIASYSPCKILAIFVVKISTPTVFETPSGIMTSAYRLVGSIN